MKIRLPRKARLLRTFRYSSAAILLMLAAWLAAPFFVSLPAGLLKNPNASPVVMDRHGTPISRFTLPDSTRAAPVSPTQIPQDLIDCTLAAEDRRFHHHSGVDYIATLRAARDSLTKQRIVSGASTITQQLVKISSPPSKRNFSAKAREILAARLLETKWSKQRILTAYLNRLDYGNLRIGAAEAARFYYQKPLADLSLAEFALLAGLPQAPSRLNPLRHPDRALTRRNTVLNRLASIGEIPADRIATALAEPLNLRPLKESQPAPWLASLAHPQRNPKISYPPPSTPDSVIHLAGKSPAHNHILYLKYEIKTTLDLDLQNDIESDCPRGGIETCKCESPSRSRRYDRQSDGRILAMVTSADWQDPRGGQINGALLPRSPGSALKPFTYLLAMENNHRSPASILADIPSSFRTPQGLNLPENYDHSYRGPVTLRGALACSLNIPAMRELNALGGPAPLHELLTRLGLTSLGADSTDDGLGLTIGNAPVRLLELTNAYATLARGGEFLPAVLFPDSPLPHVSPPIPFSETSAYLIADILSDKAARAPAFPPGGPLDLPFRCAVKTGTSSDFRDNWCLGFTPEYTVGVWGRKLRKPTHEGHFRHRWSRPNLPAQHAPAPPGEPAHLVQAA